MSASAATLEYRRLMAAANDPADIATLAFGGVLARFQIQGLDADSLTRLLGRYFPATQALTRDGIAGVGIDCVGAVCNALATEEFEDLLALLLEHRRETSEENEWLARAIASACAGSNHLWEDMGLPNRDTLSQLLRRYFTTLFYKNTGNLRWKKFFYKMLCDRAEVRLCKAPSCGVCSDYSLCFGPE
jgi:nitrogen fixation protein NifQ